MAKKPRKDKAALKTFEQETAERRERLTFETIQAAIAPVDALTAEVEARWGIDALPALVAPELAAKFGKARGLLDDAIRQRDEKLVLKYCDTVLRGLRALEQSARDAGHSPMPPNIIAARDRSGNGYHIVTEAKQYDRAIKETADPVKTVTLDELLCAYVAMRDQTNGLIDKVKAVYPGATVKSATINDTKEHNDEIPF